LPNIALQDVAHVDIVKLLDWHSGLLDSALDGRSAELWSGNVQERSVELDFASIWGCRLWEEI
jgi:hypothetical protein